MGVTFFIGPFDPALWRDGTPDPVPTTDFRIDPEAYSKQLLVRWPHAISRSGSWTLAEPNEPGTDILLHDDLLYVGFTPGANFTDFILWHRHVVPSKYLLFLFNSTSWDSLKLYIDTTRDEIRNFTRISD